MSELTTRSTDVIIASIRAEIGKLEERIVKYRIAIDTIKSLMGEQLPRDPNAPEPGVPPMVSSHKPTSRTVTGSTRRCTAVHLLVVRRLAQLDASDTADNLSAYISTILIRKVESVTLRPHLRYLKQQGILYKDKPGCLRLTEKGFEKSREPLSPYDRECLESQTTHVNWDTVK